MVNEINEQIEKPTEEQINKAVDVLLRACYTNNTERLTLQINDDFYIDFSILETEKPKIN